MKPSEQWLYAAAAGLALYALYRLAQAKELQQQQTAAQTAELQIQAIRAAEAAGTVDPYDRHLYEQAADAIERSVPKLPDWAPRS